MKQNELARFVSLTGNSPRIRFVTEDGIEFASSEEAGKEILSCTTHGTLEDGRHSAHHRGQLSTYLRPMGAKVPSIYGPSADTQSVSA